MLDPRIAQRQIEMEKRKQKPKSTPAPAPAPKPSALPKPSATKPNYTQPAAYTEPKAAAAVSPAPSPSAKPTATPAYTQPQSTPSYTPPKAASTPWYTPPKAAPAPAATPDKSFGGYSGNSGTAKPNSQQGNNQYTTAAQRQAQNAARQSYINRMQQNRTREYPWGGTSYGTADSRVKNTYTQPAAKTAGPNAEIGISTPVAKKENSVRDLYYAYLKGGKHSTDWGAPKTIKYGAQPKPVQKDVRDGWPPQAKGPNGETARTTFIDNRGESVVDKVADYIKNKTDKVKYGADDMNDTNHTNTVVTKDNVYYQSPKKIDTALSDVQNNIKGGISDRKRELEELQFSQKFAMASGGKDEYDRISQEIEKKKADIQKLQRIERKIKIGMDLNYQFIINEGEKLSEMSIDDILKSKEEFGYNLPYFSPVAQGARAVNQVRGKIEDVISVLEETKVTSRGRSFKIANTDDIENSFIVEPTETKGKNGYYEYSISVTVDDPSKLTPEQKNLYKALDDIPISATAYKTLNNMLDAAKNIDDVKLGKVSNGLFAVGEALDVVDFLAVVASDYGDDGEIGKDSSKKITGMISSWLGDIGGGVAGAKAGAAIGTAIMPGIGTVAGGAIGVVVGAYILSSAMEDIGAYLGGLDYGAEYDLEQHIVRGR